MKKKYIQLGVIALVLAVMAGALVLLRREPAAGEAGPETPAPDIIYIYGGASTENETPKQIDVKNEYGETVIENLAPAGDAEELTIRGWENLSLDTYGLGQASSNAKAMRAKEIISGDATAEELKTFGLDEPRASVTVHLQDGGKPVVLLGASAPGGEGVYVKLENENKIYLISDSAALPYFKPATAYVNKTITGTDPEFKGFDKLILTGTNYPEPLVIERTPETEVEGGGIVMNTHSFTSPMRKGLDVNRGLEPLTSVYGLLANDVVAVDDSVETLEKYGLKEPATVISVTGDTPELTFTLRISNPDENGEVYLIKDGSKVIYQLSASALPFLSLSMFDMMDRMVLVPNITTVSKVVFTAAGKTSEFVLTQDGDTLDVTANGEPLAAVTDKNGKEVTGGENFRKLYQTMIACRYDEPIPDAGTRENPATGELVETSETSETNETDVTAETAEAGEAAEPAISETGEANAAGRQPLASIQYIYNNGATPDIVAFYAGPSRKVEIELNGVGGYYGQSIYFDRLLEDVEKVLNGVAVYPYL